MDVLMSLQVSQMETDDPTTSYMLQVSHVALDDEELECIYMLCTFSVTMASFFYSRHGLDFASAWDRISYLT